MLVDVPMISFSATTDRCDRCGAQAHAQAEKGESKILFCMHHIREHEDSLLNKGWTVVTDKVFS